MKAQVAENVFENVRENIGAERSLRDGHLGPRPIPQMHESTPTTSAIGTSREWCAVLKRASQVAATEATICLQGE